MILEIQWIRLKIDINQWNYLQILLSFFPPSHPFRLQVLIFIETLSRSIPPYLLPEPNPCLPSSWELMDSYMNYFTGSKWSPTIIFPHQAILLFIVKFNLPMVSMTTFFSCSKTLLPQLFLLFKKITFKQYFILKAFETTIDKALRMKEI